MPDEPPLPFADDDALRILATGLEASTAGVGSPCPDENDLAAFLDGSASDGNRSALEAHVASCPACRRVVASISSVGAGEDRGVDSGPEAGVEEPEREGAGTPPPEYTDGAEFGPYVLRRRVGGGGMGVVYEAVHRQRGRPEALKRIRDDLGADPAFAGRFEREVRSLARVSHEHVVPLYDSGRVGDVLYYTMAFLPGPSLARLFEEIRSTGERAPGPASDAVLDRHGVPPTARVGETAAVAYARRIAGALAGPADALAAVHAAGVFHRDVKPSNLVFDPRHRVVLTDFGLAREEASRLTQAGETVGTPAYMAPEQLRAGAAVDGRADVYGLGAVLYEAWTLKAPHEGRSIAETLALVVRGDVRPPRAVNPRLPAEADVLIARCLASRAEDRYATAADLARDLQAFARGEPVLARPLPRSVRLLRSVARWKVPIAAAAAVLLAVGAYLHLRPAHVTVLAAPFAEVAIDGESVGESPVRAHRLPAGPHEITARSKGFFPMTRRVTLERGSDYVLDVALRPVDPADADALRRLAKGLGIERTEVSVDAVRTPVDDSAAVVLWPRGARRGPPTEIVLWAGVPVREVHVVLEAVDASKVVRPLVELPIVTIFQRTVVPLPDAPRVTMSSGGAYRVRLLASDGRELGVVPFSVLRDADAVRIDDDVTRVLAPTDSADPSRAILRADLLLGGGLYEEALAEAIVLKDRLGDRREVARVALAALYRAGLRDTGLWVTWAEVLARAKD